MVRPTRSSRLWSRSFLWRTAIGILVVASLASAGIGALRTPEGRSRPLSPEPIDLLGQGEAPPDPETWLDPWLADPSTDFGDLLEALPSIVLQPAARGPEGVLASIERSIHDPARRALASRVVRACFGEEAAVAALSAEASSAHPPRYANLALGLTSLLIPERAAAFEREAALYDSDRARRHALSAYAVLDDQAKLDALLEDPGYARVADARFRYELAEERLDWWGMFRWIGPAQYVGTSPTFAALGIASGIIWLIFLAYAGEVRSLASSRLALCVVALVLGALSTIPTLVSMVWMERVIGIHPSASLQGGLAYFVASVGLREELCKLLLFLPLAPIVIRRRDPLEMLVVAGCVGLGFAAEENVSYFARSGGGDAAGRFLTANFGHVVDTGLVGFAFCRMWIERERITDFVLVFVAVVIGHGVYDALIAVPALSEWSVLSSLIYLAVAFFYFGELEKYAPRRGLPVPLTAVFALGFATLVGLSLVAATWELGFGAALMTLVPGTVGVLLFVVVFVRRLNEPLMP